MRFSRILRVLIIVSIGLFNPAWGAESSDPILGQWKWFTKSTKVFHADGRLTNPEGSTRIGGSWRCVDPNGVPRRYVITWVSGMVDTLTLDKEENHLSGKNARGDRVTAARLTREDPDRTADASAQPDALGTAGTQAAAAELVKTYRDSLVFVTGKDAAGSGFVADYGTGTFLFTNAHVAAGVKGANFKTLDGVELKAGPAACAVDHDVFLFPATPKGKPFEIMMGVDEHAAIGDQVVVLGNAEGAGVINTITGRIIGLGPRLVEIDAPFQPGNSGSPIIHLKSGKVIGLATYATVRNYDTLTKERISKPVVRRFGYRLDSIKNWQQITWPTFSAQATEMEAIEKLTEVLGAYLDDLTRTPFEGVAAHENPDIQSRIEGWLGARARSTSERDTMLADRSLLDFMNVAFQADVKGARARMTYDYFQRELADQQKERDEIQRAFTEVVHDLVIRKGKRSGK